MLASAALAPAVNAATFLVNSTTDAVDASPGNGVCATAGGQCTVRAAIQEANALGTADIVQVPPGVYTLTIAGTGEDNAATGDLDITDALTITGTGNTTTAIDGGALDRVFEIYNPNVTISGVTVRNGSFSGEGGGIRVHGANALVMSDAAVVNNAAPGKSGGGIKVSSGSLTLTNVTISGNSANDAPGIFNQSATLSLINVTIANNSGTGKGSFTPGSGGLTIVNTIIANSVGVPDCDSNSGPGTNNLDSDGSCGFALTANPQLGPLQDNGGPTVTHEPITGSPAIDGGTNVGCPATDQRGTARPLDGDLDATATCDIGAVEVVPPQADLTLTKSDSPDPAPLNGPLLYTLLVTNNGPATATAVTVTDNLPASVTYVSATPSQGGCAGGAVVTCNLGAILNGGTASIEIQVLTTATGTITNNASVTATETDPVPADNTDSEDTDVVVSATVDVPLTQYQRIHGFLDYTVTGGTLRTQPNAVDPCAVGASDTASVAGIPASATIRAAYLYWAGSGSTTDTTVTLDGVPLTADRTYEADFGLGATTYEFFSGFDDVTAQVAAKRNGAYTFAGLTVTTGAPYCAPGAVIAGWSMFVIYEDTALSGKTLVLYDGFDIARNGSTSYLLSGIYASGPPEAKTTSLLWEGDETLGGASEQLLFNGVAQSDALNPIDNVYNGTINSLGSSTEYGVDLDTFDVSALVNEGDTLATSRVDTGPDLVILNAVMLQVKTNVISGTVFEDVNYGGGPGRDLATALAAAPAFTVPRPGAVVELYNATGTFLRTTTTDASGTYGFSGLPDGNYQARVVNETVTSSRPGATGAEWPVQTFRTDATGATTAVTAEVGGADPTAQDDPANLTSANLGTLTAQSIAPVTITLAVTKAGVDFGYNFDTVVNTNDSSQGSLAQFIDNANALTNTNLAQDALTAGTEHTLFMIPSNADPLGRAADPNFDTGRGVAVITVAAMLPALTDADTAIDGTTQTVHIGDTNAGLLGAGGNVGTGPDGEPATGDEPALAQIAGPEIELVDAAGLGVGLDLQANDLTVRGIAIYGFGNDPASAADANIRIDNGSNLTGALIERNVIGTPADGFTDPGAGTRSGAQNVLVLGADSGTLQDNLVGFAEGTGFNARWGAAGWTVARNEVRGNSTFGYGVGDGLAFEGAGSGGTLITNNLIIGNGAVGLETFGADGTFTIDDNTLSGNGFGSGAGAAETAGIRLYGNGSTVSHNRIDTSFGAGLLVVAGATGNQVTQNSITGNGPASGQIGIDLLAPVDDVNTGTPPYVTPNDPGDGDAGGNGLQNYPALASVISSGSNLAITGSLASTPGTTFTLEFFASSAADPSGFGEGERYLGTDTVITDGSGNAAIGSNLAVSVLVGDVVTATATSPGADTSEFSNAVVVETDLALFKRAFMLDGTPIPSGATVPQGVAFHYLLYINNRGAARTDLSVRDVLDPAFAYQPGTIRVDASTPACAAASCTPVEEAAIFAAVAATAALSEAVDGDVASFSAGDTVDAGDGYVGNAQLDVAAGRVLAMMFTVRMQ